MSDEPLLPGRSYLLRIGTKTLPARRDHAQQKVDANTLQQRPGRTLRPQRDRLLQPVDREPGGA